MSSSSSVSGENVSAGGDPSGPAAPAGFRYLRPAYLRRLRNLFFAARHIVEGYYAGRHASPTRGHSVEFNDYREYTPGDGIEQIDWKVFGRSDKLFIRLYEHNSDMVVYLLVDQSASMAYRGCDESGESLSKFEYANFLAAALAFLTVKQQDKVSFGGFDNQLQNWFAPGGTFTHLHQVLNAMEQARPGQPTDLHKALHQTFLMTRKRGLLVLLSDLLTPPGRLFESLNPFRHRGFEILLFHVLHRDEIALPAELGQTVFVDSETSQHVRAHVPDVREDYQRRINAFLAELRAGCQARNIDYNLVTTDTDYSRALERYLFCREGHRA